MRLPVNLSQVTRLINFHPCVLITSTFKNQANIMTLAWITVVSKEPPRLAISIDAGHFTYELIQKSLEFVINIPSKDQVEVLRFCGSCSGREMDKLKEGKIVLEDGKEMLTPHLANALAFLECIMEREISLGETTLIIGRIRYAEAEENLFQNGLFDAAKAKFIWHFGADAFTTNSEFIT